MYKILRIIFCVLAVLGAGTAIFIFIYFGLLWGFLVLFASVLFGVMMVFFKQMQEKKELKDNPPPPKGDFITGKVKAEDENSPTAKQD